MITYDDYIKRYDDMDEDEFDILVLNVTLFLETYCESFISQFKLKDNFKDYGLDIDEAIIQQLHFANENGGLSLLMVITMFRYSLYQQVVFLILMGIRV